MSKKKRKVGQLPEQSFIRASKNSHVKPFVKPSVNPKRKGRTVRERAVAFMESYFGSSTPSSGRKINISVGGAAYNMYKEWLDEALKNEYEEDKPFYNLNMERIAVGPSYNDVIRWRIVGGVDPANYNLFTREGNNPYSIYELSLCIEEPEIPLPF